MESWASRCAFPNVEPRSKRGEFNARRGGTRVSSQECVVIPRAKDYESSNGGSGCG